MLRLVLADGRPATLLVGPASTVLSVDDRLVSSWDLCGRPYALVREGGTYRRGLDGRLLLKREARDGTPRVRRRLTAAEGEAVVESARFEAAAAHAAISRLVADRGYSAEAKDRLTSIVKMDAAALAGDAARFLSDCGPVGILPPDQYLSLVVHVTEGCSWNACRFCGLYHGRPFRVKTRDELGRHVAAVRAYFGRSLALRRTVFLGDANALCLAQDRLLAALETVARAFPGAPLASFVDAWTGRRKLAADWRACKTLGLGRVYVGLETGDPGLLSWLGKAGTPEDAIRLVSALHEAELGVGVVVLLGAGGERFDSEHVRRTAAALAAMRLGTPDILCFSAYVDDPSLAYGRHAAGQPDLAPLPPDRMRAQRAAISEAVRSPGLRVVRYDLREFVY